MDLREQAAGFDVVLGRGAQIQRVNDRAFDGVLIRRWRLSGKAHLSGADRDGKFVADRKTPQTFDDLAPPVAYRNGRIAHAHSLDTPLELVRLTDEAQHELGLRRLEHTLCAIDLLDPSRVHDRDPVGYRERLILIVGDENGRDVQPALEIAELDLHLVPQRLVERREGLIEKQHRRFQDQSAGNRDALLLAAGQLGRQSPAQPAQLDHFQRLVHDPPDIGFGHAAHAKAEGHVLPDGHMRKQRIVLEHEANVAPVRRHTGNVATPYFYLSLAWLDQSGNQTQQRRLAATARAKQG